MQSYCYLKRAEELWIGFCACLCARHESEDHIACDVVAAAIVDFSVSKMSVSGECVI